MSGRSPDARLPPVRRSRLGSSGCTVLYCLAGGLASVNARHRLVTVSDVHENGAVTTEVKSRKADATLAAAVDIARTVLLEEVPESHVGQHRGMAVGGERVVTHFFACAQPGYVGWRWGVTLARAPRQKHVTVNEVTMLPGDESLVAPDWVPWKDRLAKDDLGPGDLNPRPAVDERLVPGYLVGDSALDESTAREQREVAREMGLGRELVLSIEGRDAAAERWYAGDHGPEAPIARAAPGHCATCGFFLRMSGPLSRVFGVCANGSAPNDGAVVSLDHGCGAHSDLVEEPSEKQSSSAEHAFDTITWDTWGDSDLEIISR